MWKMWQRRLQDRCRGRRRRCRGRRRICMRPQSSAAALASTPTRNCSEPLHRSQGQAHVDPNSICRLVRAGLVRGNAPKPAHYPQSSRTDAGRQRVVAGNARIWRPWNFTALGRGNSPGNIMGALIKRVSRIVRQNRAAGDPLCRDLAAYVPRKSVAKSKSRK
jgi:hypothetical protein